MNLRSRLLLALVICASSVAVIAQQAEARAVFLTPAEKAEVVSIARNDPRVAEVLGGADVPVDNVLPWSEDGERKTLIGARVTFALDPPRTLEADWPLIDFPVDNAYYTINMVHFRADDVAWLDVEVDLCVRRVVAFDIGDGTVDQSTVRVLDAPSAKAGGSSDDGQPAAAVAVVCAGSALVAAGAVAVARRRGR